jgi:hypothetical protein
MRENFQRVTSLLIRVGEPPPPPRSNFDPTTTTTSQRKVKKRPLSLMLELKLSVSAPAQAPTLRSFSVGSDFSLVDTCLHSFAIKM